MLIGAGLVVVPVHELIEWFSSGRVWRWLQSFGWIAERDDLAHESFVGDAKKGLSCGRRCPTVAGSGEVAERGTDAVRRRGQQDAHSRYGPARRAKTLAGSVPRGCEKKASRSRPMLLRPS